MPAHSLYLLQSLNIRYFALLKCVYSCLVKNKMRLGFNYINKFNFLKTYPNVCTEDFRLKNILALQ